MYAIAGVTGNTGRAAAESLLDAGHRVRVVVRDASKAAPFVARGAEVAVAPLEDVAALTKALEGTKGAYLLAPPDLSAPDYLASRCALVDAVGQSVRSAGLPHLVFLSSIGAQHAQGTGPIRSLHYAEKVLGALEGTKTTFIRASYFADNLGSLLGAAREQGVLPGFFDVTRAIPMVDTADIGRVAASALVEGREGILELRGPQERSFTDAAAELGEILGRTVQAVRVPDEGVVPALVEAGLPAGMAALYAEMSRGIESGLVGFEGKTAVRGQVTLAQTLRRLAAV